MQRLSPFASLPLLAALALACVLPAREAHAQAPLPARMPVTLGDDFEDGEASAWESYPYAQDPGFNPTILTIAEPAHNDSRFSLCQIFEPSGTDYPVDLNRIGMVKRHKLFLRTDSRVRAAVFISADRKPTSLKLILCGADGEAYELKLSAPAANEWITLDAPAEDFKAGAKPAAPGCELQAVAVYAEFGPVSPARSYQINLDDFQITGEQDQRFTGIEPQTTYLQHFDRTILHRHYAPGEAISLRLAATTGDAPASLSCTLLDPAGKTIAETDLRAGDSSEWHADAIYSFTPQDQPGPWRARLTGKTASGAAIDTSIHFIVQPRRLGPADHPRLFFDATGLAAIVNDPSPERQALLASAIKTARSRIESAKPADYPEDHTANTISLGGPQYATEWADYGRWRKGLSAGYPLHDAALLYAFTGETPAAEKAAQLLLHIAAFNGWNHPWFDARHMSMYYPMGYAAYHAAVGYDLAHAQMTPDQRAVVRAGLLRNVIQPAFEAEVLNDGIPSNVSNHLGVSMGGALIATIALLGEDPANPDMEPYFSGFLAKLQAHLAAAYLADGSYAESFCYHHMDSETVTKAVAALERNTGVDLTNSTHFGRSYLYSLYTATTDGQNCPDMGDALAYWGSDSKNHFLWLAHRLGDPLALDRYRWLTGKAMQKPIATDFYDAIWMPQAVDPKPVATLPPAAAFPQKGNVIFRSDWTDDGLLFNFHAGPHNNHFHFDQGTFLLRYAGEDLIVESGYADYYYNLNYKPFYTQAIGHNTLLLGGHPESQMHGDMDNGIAALGTYARILEAKTEGPVRSVEAELAPVYKGRLQSYRRTIVQMPEDYLVICDRVQAVSPERFNWIFHPAGDRQSLGGEGNTIRITRPRAQLRMELLAPQPLQRQTLDYPDAPRVYLDLSTAERSQTAYLITVLIPSKPENQAERDTWQITALEGDPATHGVRIQRGAQIDTIRFETGATPDAASKIFVEQQK